MTRTALRRAVPAHLRGAIARWALHPGSLPRELRRAGFKKLPAREHGIEREVLVSAWIVLKTTGWRGAPDARKCRARTLAPTIVVAPGVIAQPRGRVLGRRWGYELESAPPRIAAKFARSKKIAAARYQAYDDHTFNYALFPDGTVRCIDF